MNNYPLTEKELDEALDESESYTNEFKEAFRGQDKHLAVHSFAKHLIEKYSVKTIRGAKREVYVYQDGVYVSGEDILKKVIRQILEELCTSHRLKEIIETVKDLTPINRDAMKVSTNLINLNNGVFNILSGKLEEHNPKHHFLSKIPVDFDENADCPAFKKYLSDVLDEDQITVIQEWLGYTLYREYSFKKALICVGEGDTGKSTLITQVDTFFSPKNVSGVNLQQISTDKFAAANMFEKYVNLYDDLSAKDVNDNGAFKIATGGGVITGEKKFSDQFTFRNYAKLTFACNKIPDVKDTHDDAYFRRWIVISFNRTIEEENQDKELGKKMSTPTELSGMLNFALEGLKRLLKQGKFTYDKDANEIKTEMLRSGSVVARFSYDCLEESSGDWISKQQMYEAFTQYVSTQKLPAVSIQRLGSRLPMCTVYIAECKPTDPQTGLQVTAWRNVKFKEGFTPPEEKDSVDFDDYPTQEELLSDQIS